MGGGDADLCDANPNNEDLFNATTDHITSEFEVETFFRCDDMWSNTSRKYFIREHRRKGDSLRGLVINSLLDQHRSNDFTDLSEDEMYRHLHIAHVHYGVPQAKSRDICEMTRDVVGKYEMERDNITRLMGEAFEESVRKVMSQFTTSRKLN